MSWRKGEWERERILLHSNSIIITMLSSYPTYACGYEFLTSQPLRYGEKVMIKVKHSIKCCGTHKIVSTIFNLYVIYMHNLNIVSRRKEKFEFHWWCGNEFSTCTNDDGGGGVKREAEGCTKLQFNNDGIFFKKFSAPCNWTATGCVIRWRFSFKSTSRN